MISHMLDTDVCIFTLKKRSAALLNKLEAHDGRMAISDVTLFELHFGAHGYAEPQQRITIIEDFAARLTVLPFDSDAARHAGEIRASLTKRGQMIGAYDLMIAGIARCRELVLATNNVREFNRVAGLRTEKWV